MDCIWIARYAFMAITPPAALSLKASVCICLFLYLVTSCLSIAGLQYPGHICSGKAMNEIVMNITQEDAFVLVHPLGIEPRTLHSA